MNYYLATSFYNSLGFAETNCSNDNAIEAETKPTIALYCLPSNDTSNGSCQIPTFDMSNYTHAAVKSSSVPEIWTSKFGYGPLLAHESLDNLTGGSNCSTGPVIGKPILCFRPSLNLKFNIRNQSPYLFHVENITLYSGDWKDNKPPLSAIEPILGFDTFELVGNKEVEGAIWYRVSLGVRDSNQSKIMGYYSLAFQLTTHSEENNFFSLYDTVSSNETSQDLFYFNYSSQTGVNGPWQFPSLATSGYPVTVNLTGEWSANGTASHLLQKWQELDPLNKGATLEEIANCIFSNQTAFNLSQVVDDFDDGYNAFGWTVGDTLEGNYLNPSDTYEDVITFYNHNNNSVVDCASPSATVALFCNINSTDKSCIENYHVAWGTYNYTHAASKLSDGNWSSKFWSGPLLTPPDLISLSGKCSNLQHLPNFIGSPILCFEPNTSMIDRSLFSLTQRFDKTNVPPKGLGLDYSSQVNISNDSPYYLVRSYLQKWKSVCKILWWNCGSEPDGQTFDGMKILEGGSWKYRPDRWIDPFDKDYWRVEDPALSDYGSGSAVTYDIYLGDFRQNIMSEKTFYEKSTKKLLDSITFTTTCPYGFRSNIATVSKSLIPNPSTFNVDIGEWADPQKICVWVSLSVK